MTATSDPSTTLPDVQVRGWRLAVVTVHGVRLWWHAERKQPWASGLIGELSRPARQYAMDCWRAWQRARPIPPLPDLDDQVLPWDTITGLIELDVATLDEGDPV